MKDETLEALKLAKFVEEDSNDNRNVSLEIDDEDRFNALMNS